MKKTFCFVICILLFAGLFAAPVKTEAGSMAIKNWQQDEPSVPGYVHGNQKGTWWYQMYGGDNFGNTGCGVMALVNAVHYITGNFMDPLEVADWAYELKDSGGNRAYSGDLGTYREILYPKVEAKFGSKYGFRIADTGTYGTVKDSKFVNHIKNGGSAVVHTKGHFMAIVDYDVNTGKFLLWDNCAGDGRGGKRAGATHKAGDWLTADQLEGSLNKEYLTVDWYCLVSSTVPVSSEYKEITIMDNIELGFSESLTSGILSSPTDVTVGDSAGMVLTANGWHASTFMIKTLGYSVDGGSIHYDVSFSVAADQAVQDAAVQSLGGNAYATRFSVSVPLTDNKAHTYKIYSMDGDKETCIWTVNKKMNGNPSEETNYSGKISSFYPDGIMYSVRIYQNGTSDSSYTSEWGGMDGISDKKLSKDAKLYIFGAVSLQNKNCRRIGLLVDNSYVIWPEDVLVKTSQATRTDCFLPSGADLGSSGFMFDICFDTSELKSGNHVLKLVFDNGNGLTEIGTRTSQYGGGCFVINASSSGANYSGGSVSEPTKAPTEAPTEAPTKAPTKAPTEAPSEAPTKAPAETPTEVPTEVLTEAPTEAQTEVTADAPTEAPTEAPAQAPTDVPADEATAAPSETAAADPESEEQGSSMKRPILIASVCGIAIIAVTAAVAFLIRKKNEK